MRFTTNQSFQKMTTEKYIQQNPIVGKFIENLYQEFETYFSSGVFNTEYWELIKDKKRPKLQVGSKFIKIVVDGGAWGFIARNDGELGGVPYKRGDLMKAATWGSPAKKSRGNIINGTAKYDVYGPSYL